MKRRRSNVTLFEEVSEVIKATFVDYCDSCLGFLSQREAPVFDFALNPRASDEQLASQHHQNYKFHVYNRAEYDLNAIYVLTSTKRCSEVSESQLI